MKRPVLKLVFALLPLALCGWFWATDVGLEDVVPATAGSIIRLNHPLDSAQKLADAEIIKSVARMPDMNVVRLLLNNWTNLQQHDGLMAGAAYLLRSFHISVPSDLTRYSSSQMPFTTYIDLGAGGRAFGMLAGLGLFAKGEAFAQHRGVRVYQKGGGAVAFIRNMLVVGPPEAVIQSIDAYAEGRAPVGDNPERYRTSLKLADSSADASMMLMSRSYFRAPEERAKAFDPRAFFNAAAIQAATLNGYLEDEGLSLQMILAGLNGKVLSPFTLDKPAEHPSLVLPDEGTYLYAAVRVRQPSALAPVLVSALSGKPNMQPLQKKLVMMVLTKFLENTGNEVAMALDFDNPGGFPTLLFEISNVDEMRRILERMAQGEDLQHNVLNAPLGPNGETIQQLIATAASDKELEKTLTLVPADRRSEIIALARKIRLGTVTADQIALDPQRIGMFGRALHWRMVGNLLVVAPLPDLADRYATNLQAKKVMPELEQQRQRVPLDGPFVACVNLGAPLALSDPEGEHLASWLAAQHPRLTIGSRVTDERVEFSAFLPAKMGIRAVTFEASGFWTALFYVSNALVWFILLGCVYVVFKALRALAQKRQSNAP